MNSVPNGVCRPTKAASNGPYMLYGIYGNQAINTAANSEQDILHGLEILQVEELNVACRAISKEQLHSHTDSKNMQRFTAILSELHRQGDILPFRFGTILDANELLTLLSPLRESVLHSLNQISGCTEINIRWALPADGSTPGNVDARTVQRPSTGSEYMQLKRQAKIREQYMESLVIKTANDFALQFGSDCVDVRSSIRSMKTLCPERSSPKTYCIARVDLLVQRRLQSTILEAAKSLEICGMKPTLVTGPWPPFSFIAIDSNDGMKNETWKPESAKQVWLEANA